VRAVNLIPSDQRPGAGGTYGRSGGVAYALVGLACGLVVMCALWLMARKDMTNANAQVSQITAQAQQAQNEATALASYNTFVSTSNSRVSGIEQLTQDRFDWAHAFHELGRVLPVNVTLTTVTGAETSATSSSAPSPPTGATGASGASAVTSASPAGTVPTLAIVGCTANQAQVAFMLQRLALIDGVTNVTLSKSAFGTDDTSSANCDVVFTVTVTFTALPTVSPTQATGASPSAGTVAAIGGPPNTVNASAAAAPAGTATASITGPAGPSGPSGPSGATASAASQTGAP